MSETKVAVFGASLTKDQYPPHLLVQSPLFQEHTLPNTAAKCQLPTVCSCRMSESFSLLERTFSAEFRLIRRTIFGVMCHFFCRFSALFHCKIHHFFVWPWRPVWRVAWTQSNGLEFEASREPKASCVQTCMASGKSCVITHGFCMQCLRSAGV